MVRLFTIQQFEVKITTRFIGEPLEKLPRQAKSKRRGHILFSLGSRKLLIGKLVQAAPNQIRAPAEIDHATRQCFIHWDVSFGLHACWMRIPTCAISVKASSISANSSFLTECLAKRLPKSNPA